VGAPIPETQSFSRETARLKGQLTGKRSRDDEEVVKRGKAESSDEESRAGAIKKKARLDPFGDGNGKKKRKKQVATNDSTGSASASPSVAGPTDIEMSEQAEVLGMVTEADPIDAHDAAVSSAQTPIHDSSATSAKPTSTSSNYLKVSRPVTVTKCTSSSGHFPHSDSSPVTKSSLTIISIR
jgi:hypothetical protein